MQELQKPRKDMFINYFLKKYKIKDCNKIQSINSNGINLVMFLITKINVVVQFNISNKSFENHVQLLLIAKDCECKNKDNVSVNANHIIFCLKILMHLIILQLIGKT